MERGQGATEIRLLPSHLFLRLIWPEGMGPFIQSTLKDTKKCPSHLLHYSLSNVLLEKLPHNPHHRNIN